MKIAIFSDCYFPCVNGVSTSIKDLTQSLLDSGHEVLLVVPEYPNEQPESDGLFSSGVRMLRVPSKPYSNYPGHRQACPGMFFKWDVLREFSPDIIHIQTPFQMGKLALKWGKKLRVPCVFTYHTLFESYLHYLHWPLPKFATLMIVRAMTKRFCHKCKAVIAPSQYVADYLYNTVHVKRPIHVIPSGVPTALFSGGNMCEAAKYVSKVGATHLLYVGRLAKEKNLDFIWQAFAVMRPRYPALRLIVVGDGPYRQYLENLTKLMRLEDSIVFVGQQPRERLKHFFALSRCLLFASETETQGLVLAEAQSAGVPVVAVRAGGVEESVREGVSGFLVNPKDVNGFVERVTCIVENGDTFVALSRSARSWASQFAFENTSEQIVNCYNEVLGKPHRKATRLAVEAHMRLRQGGQQ